MNEENRREHRQSRHRAADRRSASNTRCWISQRLCGVVLGFLLLQGLYHIALIVLATSVSGEIVNKRRSIVPIACVMFYPLGVSGCGPYSSPQR